MQQYIADLAFMDDTTWISSSKSNLEIILSITNSFYTLNNILINPDKAVILTTNTFEIEKDDTLGYSTSLSVVDNINDKIDLLRIKSILLTHSSRFLGVWINTKCNKSFVYNQVKKEILSDVRIMKNKILTDKQMLYIYNTVIIPKLEYRIQLSCLTDKDCLSLQAPFRTMIKGRVFCI